jgi:hypothetical protein
LKNGISSGLNLQRKYVHTPTDIRSPKGIVVMSNQPFQDEAKRTVPTGGKPSADAIRINEYPLVHYRSMIELVRSFYRGGYTVTRRPVGVIEWDNDLPPLPIHAGELSRARNAVAGSREAP